jgi:hypothetical protein
MTATNLTPEKARLVAQLQGRKKDVYLQPPHNKYAKGKRSTWLYEQAIAKCGGRETDGAETRAATLVRGACDLQKVASDPAVQALLWSANEKVQKTVVDSTHSYYQDGDRSLAAKVFSDASNVG